jgi:hypothetical protein
MPAWLYPHPESTNFQKARCDFFAGKKDENMPIDPQEGFIAVWQYLVDRYKTNGNVIGANIINEPWMVRGMCGPKDLKLNEFYTRVGKAIQAIRPDMLLIYEDSQDFHDVDFALTRPLELPNSIYSFHLYTGNWEPDGLKRTIRFLSRASQWDVPLFIGEFDMIGTSWNKNAYGPADWQDQGKEMLSYFKKNGISWAFWAYSGYQSLLVSPGTEVKEDLLRVLQSEF